MTVSNALEFDAAAAAAADANEEWRLAKKELRALSGYRGKGLYKHFFTRKQVPGIAESIEFWKGVKVNDYMYLDPAYLVRARALVEKITRARLKTFMCDGVQAAFWNEAFWQTLDLLFQKFGPVRTCTIMGDSLAYRLNNPSTMEFIDWLIDHDQFDIEQATTLLSSGSLVCHLDNPDLKSIVDLFGRDGAVTMLSRNSVSVNIFKPDFIDEFLDDLYKFLEKNLENPENLNENEHQKQKRILRKLVTVCTNSFAAYFGKPKPKGKAALLDQIQTKLVDNYGIEATVSLLSNGSLASRLYEDQLHDDLGKAYLLVGNDSSKLVTMMGDSLVKRFSDENFYTILLYFYRVFGVNKATTLFSSGSFCSKIAEDKKDCKGKFYIDYVAEISEIMCVKEDGTRCGTTARDGLVRIMSGQTASRLTDPNFIPRIRQLVAKFRDKLKIAGFVYYAAALVLDDPFFNRIMDMQELPKRDGTKQLVREYSAQQHK